jgi:hypothetical protein
MTDDISQNSSSRIELEDESSEDKAFLEEDLEEEPVETIIEEYSGFANDNVVLFYTYFFVFLLWMFYEETYIAGLYGIGILDF